MIGKTISHYRIVEKLGEGGMGIVYLAEDTKLGRKVALKFLSRGAALPEDEHRRFINEAQAAASLNHANISTIYEIEESDEGPFIAMEYIAGDNLSDRIADGPLPVEESIEIAIQVLKGLDQAHSQEIVHRDIKSANIMIKKNGTAKIMDFGLAKLADRTRLTREGAAPGTVAYMSPEQAQGKDVDHRSDIWSSGAVLYEMITGRQPFAGEYEQAMIYSILNDPPPPPTSVRTGIPMELERIALKALSKDPGERYQHADGMIADLRALRRKSAAGVSTAESAGTSAAGAVSPPAAKSHRFRSTGIAVSLIIAMLAVIFVIRPLFFGSELVAGQRPIAVITFENRTGDESYDYLSAAIPNLLITSLEQSRRLQVMTWERMQDLLEQTGREGTEIIDKDLGFELCELDGIDVVVVGSYIRAGSSFAIEAKVMDVRTKKLLHTASTEGDGVESILKSQIDELSGDITRDISRLSTPELSEPISGITTTSMEAYNYYLKGIEYADRWLRRDAEIHLERAIELDSTFAAAYIRLSFIKYQMLETETADSLLSKAMHFADATSEKDRLRIEAEYAKKMENDPEKAIGIIEERIRRFPREKESYLTMLNWKRGQGMYSEAIEYGLEALELDPLYKDALNGMGYTYLDLNEYEKALEYFERYAAVSPDDPNPWDSMGDCLYRLGRIDDSKASYRKAFEKSPDFFTSKMCLSYLYMMEGEVDSAIYWVESAARDTWYPAMKSIALIYSSIYMVAQGRYREAEQMERTAYKSLQKSTNPRRETFILRFSPWRLYRMGRFDESIESIDRYRRRVEELGLEIPIPAEISMISLQGLNAIAQDRIDDAKAADENMKTLVSSLKTVEERNLMRMVRRMPTLLEAEVLLADGRPADAIAYMAQRDTMYIPILSYAQAGYYNMPSYQDVVARAYVRLGDNAKAIEEYERMLTFDPESADRRVLVPVYLYRVAVLYEQEGRYDLADAHLERYLDIMKHADEGIFEVEDAKRRLEKLRSSSSLQ
jgi:tetratricopeptide (TPR) repeat protein/TolB-like protein/predicted Ser/Thr protein kinase